MTVKCGLDLNKPSSCLLNSARNLLLLKHCLSSEMNFENCRNFSVPKYCLLEYCWSGKSLWKVHNWFIRAKKRDSRIKIKNFFCSFTLSEKILFQCEARKKASFWIIFVTQSLKQMKLVTDKKVVKPTELILMLISWPTLPKWRVRGWAPHGCPWAVTGLPRGQYLKWPMKDQETAQ